MSEIILNFHGVGQTLASVDEAERRFWWDEKSFLKALDEICAPTVPPSSVVRITFDDGNASDAEIALPALVERGMIASFFVCAGRIGKQGYLDATAIRDLLHAGMKIGSHGMNHLDWRKIDEAALDAEIVGARKAIEDVCGCTVDDVGIPFGSYDYRVLGKLRSEGYRHAYSSDGGIVWRDSWMKARNTLDRSWQSRGLIQELTARESRVKRLKRALSTQYKALR